MMLGLESFDALKIISKDYPVPSLDYDRVKNGLYNTFLKTEIFRGSRRAVRSSSHF